MTFRGENIFARLAKRLDTIYMRPEKQNATREEFEADVREALQAWADNGTIKQICTSMPKRFRDVLDADGGPTKY